mgnify:FL=1
MLKKNARVKKRVLLAIPSFLDPELFQKKGKIGPILQMIHEHDFDEVILVGLQVWRLNAFLTEQAINTHFPKIKVTRYILNINNIGSYKEVFYELKNLLTNCENQLQGICDEPVVLLPPSVCDCLLDCWLLLTTSLNINVRICQVEPHYSSEGVYLQNTEDQNLDWLFENDMEFRDFNRRKTLSQEISCLTQPQLSSLQALCLNKKAFCLQGLDSEMNLSIQRHFAKTARQNNQNYLFIDCSEIPEEIMHAVLCGYKKSIDTNKTIERKGLFSKIKSGWLVLSDFEKLSLEIQQYLKQISHNEKDLHVIGIENKSSQTSPVFPSFPFTT